MENTEFSIKKWISFNKIGGFLWKGIQSGEAEINEDQTKVRYMGEEHKIKKSSLFEIVFLKYVLALVFAWFLAYDVNLYYPSMMALWMVIASFYLADRYKTPTSVLYFYFFGLAITSLYVSIAVKEDYNFGFIFNYMVQYIVGIYIVTRVWKDFINKGFEGYYTVAKRPFTFLKIYDDEKLESNIKFDDTTKQKLTFGKNLFVFSVFIFALVASITGLTYEIDSKTKQEYVAEKMGGDIYNYDHPWYQEHLTLLAKELGIEPLHLRSEYIFKGLDGYTKKTVEKGQPYKYAYDSQMKEDWEEFKEVYLNEKLIDGHLKRLKNDEIRKLIVADLRAQNINVDDDFNYGDEVAYNSAWNFGKDFSIKNFTERKELVTYMLHGYEYFVEYDSKDKSKFKVYELLKQD
jgi:hypothetical protein